MPQLPELPSFVPPPERTFENPSSDQHVHINQRVGIKRLRSNMSNWTPRLLKPDNLVDEQTNTLKAEIDNPHDDSNRSSELAGVRDHSNLSPARKLLLGGIMMATYFIASATISASLLIIPPLAKDLGVDELKAQWVSSACSLALGCGMLVSGRLADMYGRKGLYLLGIGLFLISSIVSGFIRHFPSLCLIRSISGLSISLSLPSAFGITGSTFLTEPGRTRAFLLMGVGNPLGGGLGQVLGGVMAVKDRRGWEWLFFVLGGMGLVVGGLGWVVIPGRVCFLRQEKDGDVEGAGVGSGRVEDGGVRVVSGGIEGSEGESTEATNNVAGSVDPATSDKRIDWLGAGLITSAFGILGFALTQGEVIPAGWSEPYIPVLFVLSITMIIAFGFWEHNLSLRSYPALVDLSIFTRQKWKFTSVLLISFTAQIAIGGWMYVTSIWYQNLKHETPLQNALHVLTAPMMGIPACLLASILLPRVKSPYLLVFGCLCTSASSWLYAVQPLGTSYWACEWIANIVNPFGADLIVGICSVMISNLVSPEEQSLAGALFQTSLQLASTFGTCLSSLVQTLVEKHTGDLLRAERGAFGLLAGFAALAGVITVLTLRGVGLAKDVRQKSARPS